MSGKLFLELVSPERLLVRSEVDEVYAPGSEGDLGILPEHTAFICSLRSGEFRFYIGDNVEYVALDGGFMEVVDNKVTVLADGAELGREINVSEVLRRKLVAEKDVEDARQKDNIDFTTAEAKLMKEIIRINVAGKYKT
ncbi:MAG: ATP synthase F1 subunit epsilon [Deferribacteraceae bacterium]|jgi:F-type H+-transporting ATPase subunit epsilon|nr:ATP synthase F1 subunit epsilon [Deferribacteraceae bacterium]